MRAKLYAGGINVFIMLFHVLYAKDDYNIHIQRTSDNTLSAASFVSLNPENTALLYFFYVCLPEYYRVIFSVTGINRNYPF